MPSSTKKALVIGAGFAGLSVATFLAKKGWMVTVIEKHNIPGGRARKFEAQGFTFDMGPSWYWMPDVFERYFASFGKKVADFYELKRLDPSYRVYFDKTHWDKVMNRMNELPQDERGMSSRYGDGNRQYNWKKCTNRVFSIYVPAIVKHIS